MKSKQEATKIELNNIRNLMYVFIATTAILTTTTVYFVIHPRRPQVKKKQTTLEHYQVQDETEPKDT